MPLWYKSKVECEIKMYKTLQHKPCKTDVNPEALLKEKRFLRQRGMASNPKMEYTTKNILGIVHPKHSILLLVSRILEGNSGNFSLLVASNQIYFLQEMNFSN